MSTPALELRGVTKSYGDRVALDDVSIGIERGELVALVGANGAGKSTLLQLAVGLLEPTSGDVLVEGAPAGSLDARRSLSYIADNPALYDDLSVNEHIEYVTRLHGVAERPESADELLAILNLGARADDLPARFSRGLRQKTAIVLALVRPFSLLLVDEPFVGLDPRGQDALAELLTAAAEAGCAVMVATHQLVFLERASRCVALRDGAIAYRGPVDRAVIDPLLD
ncbi:MAG TPA: ABC transporter ATP-binding protein [Acidimicrobiia bacterium]|jgi:ABC-type multidrug transport system ATPase subunit|nr:ABC transporter ATP-binding protein [Acidimicrobiia bacterium]